MNTRQIQYLAVTLMLALLITAGFQLLSLSGHSQREMGNVQTLDAAATTTAMGEYIGFISLNGTHSGDLNSAPTTTQTLQLGMIDLALTLTRTGNVVTGAVVLDKTLVFPKQGSSGPRVEGTLDGQRLVLTSAPFTTTIAPGIVVTRTFRLESSEVDGPVVKGTYRETMTGAGVTNVTVMGRFQIQRPLLASEVTPETPVTPEVPTQSPGKLYIPAIQRGVENATVSAAQSVDQADLPTNLYLPSVAN